MEIICFKVINCHHDNLLAEHFKIYKLRELIAMKYFWPTFCQNIKAYIKDYDIYLVSKKLCHKLYSDLQSLQVLTHY